MAVKICQKTKQLWNMCKYVSFWGKSIYYYLKVWYNKTDCPVWVWYLKLIRRYLQKVIDINGQKITLALEPAVIYKAKKIEDIWFFDWSGSDKEGFPPYKESIYPLTIFKGSHDKWEEGLDAIYKMICNGRYGTYDGKWITSGELL